MTHVTIIICSVPSLSGQLVYAGRLVDHIDDRVPVLGLQPKLLSKDLQAADGFNELAHLYVRALKNHDPAGPYALVGYSFGAIMAMNRLAASDAAAPTKSST